jgi:hypothetical protein
VATFERLARSSADASVRDEALAALAASRDPQAPALLVALLPSLTVSQRGTALDRLAGTTAGATALLAGLRANTVSKSDLGVNTAGNVTQGNAFGYRPDGALAAQRCAGVDHNPGPTSNLLGGDAEGEGNLIAGAACDGVEYSHGWDPATHSFDVVWQVNDNRAAVRDFDRPHGAVEVDRVTEIG